MQLYKIRGGSEEELRARLYNIGVGISLGNKWFTPQNILGLVEWSLEYTKEYVIVYVADSIHAINVEVRQRKSPEKARVIASMLGAEVLGEVKALVDTKLSREQLLRIHYARWDDLLTPEFTRKHEYLDYRYKTDSTFRDAILNIVNCVTQNESKHFSYDDKVRLGDYLIAELPELLARVTINGVSFDANAYPCDGKLVELVENVQKGELFPEIKETILDTKPKVFLEVRE